MEDDPEREENFAEQWAPGLVAAVEGVGEAGDNSDESSPNSVSSAALAVTVKLVSIPAIILRIPWNTAKRWAETPPITQNCSLRHQSSMLTPLHRNSRMLVTMMAINSPRNRALARIPSPSRERGLFMHGMGLGSGGRDEEYTSSPAHLSSLSPTPV
nr:Cellulose synthase-like protein D2 [Ipomoea batatas]